jgi:hypothetical protein
MGSIIFIFLGWAAALAIPGAIIYQLVKIRKAKETHKKSD